MDVIVDRIEGDYAVVEKEKGKMCNLPIELVPNVKEGDVVTTSGLGGMFPRGIYIGEVKKVTNDKYGLSKTLGVKTTQDFNNIHYVTVLKEEKN